MPTLLITGANRGIGLELTKRYAADGWTIIAACRTPKEAAALAALKGDITIEALDVTDYAAVDRLAAKYGGTAIDLLLNNAGIYGNRDGALTVSDFDTYLQVLHVNSVAPMKLALAFLPHLKRATAAKIATISSRLGSIELGSGGSYAYRASKAAINAGMHNLALDLKSSGISCITLHPGWVKTDMGGAGADIDVGTSAAGLKKVIDGLTLKDTGRFYNYDGAELPW